MQIKNAPKIDNEMHASWLTEQSNIYQVQNDTNTARTGHIGAKHILSKP